MDIYFDLVLPGEINIEYYGFSEQLIYWGNEALHQEPPKYKWRDNINFVKNGIRPSYDKLLPNIYNAYDIYSLDDESIYLLESSINEGIFFSDNYLIGFINECLPNFDSWVVALSLDEDRLDGIDSVLNINQEYDLLIELKRNINWSNEKGFIAFKNLQAKIG